MIFLIKSYLIGSKKDKKERRDSSRGLEYQIGLGQMKIENNKNEINYIKWYKCIKLIIKDKRQKLEKRMKTNQRINTRMI